MNLTLPEILYLRKFFDEVDYAVSCEMATASLVYEESLSFLFARFMDSGSRMQSVLDYTIGQLNTDLASCGSGNQVEVKFDTHEHAKGYSGDVSHADLGIVLIHQSPLSSQTIQKAILVECKRLYPAKNGYSVQSAYEAFDDSQCKHLKDFNIQYGGKAVYYFLYNPLLQAFDDNSASAIRAVENELISRLFSFPHGIDWEDFIFGIRKYWRHMPFLFPMGLMGYARDISDPEQAKQHFGRETSRRPGMRVLSVASVEGIIGQKKKGISRSTEFTLSECYKYGRSDQWVHMAGAVPFVTLSTFLVDFFIGCVRGSNDDTVLRVARGEKVDVAGQQQNTNVEGSPSILAKHTLTITIRSVLPEAAHSFRME